MMRYKMLLLLEMLGTFQLSLQSLRHVKFGGLQLLKVFHGHTGTTLFIATQDLTLVISPIQLKLLEPVY